MRTTQANIHDDVVKVCSAALEAFGFVVAYDPAQASDGSAVVVYDEYGLQAWPPEPPASDAQLPRATVVVQPGSETLSDGKYTNIDQYEQEMLVGVTVAGRPSCTPEPTSEGTPEQIAKRLKGLLIQALRCDRTRGGLAIDTTRFQSSFWTWGDGSGGGCSIVFLVRWWTDANSPDEVG